MAQVEILMYVAFGFATAALIALLLGRLMWNLAIGVGRRRAQRTAATPAVAQLLAERNQLRAEQAMLARKVELRLGELKMQVAEQMAEVSRSRNRVDRLSGEIVKRDASLAEQDKEIARLKQHGEVVEAEVAARTGSLHELPDRHGEGGHGDEALVRQLAERDLEIARLRAEVERLAVARSEAVSRQRGVQERLKGRIEDLAALSRQIEAQRRVLVVQQSQTVALPEPEKSEGELQHGAPLARGIETAERQASELLSELDRLDEIWAAKLADVARAVAVEPAATEAGDEAMAPADADKTVVINGSAGRPIAMDPAVADGGTGRAEDEKKPTSGLANVISLAQRIRALQRSGS